MLFYKTNQYSGSLQSSDEGEVFWIPRNKLMDYTLASDFEEMIQIFEQDNLNEFYYYKSNDDFKKSIL